MDAARGDAPPAARRLRGPPPTTRDALCAGAVAALVSGAPSTAFALATGRDPLEATRAAATLVPGRQHRPGVVAGIGVHLVISGTWTAVFALAARARPMTASAGAMGGAAIAALDLGVIARRRHPAIAALPSVPQVADHLVFGAVLGHMLRTEPGGRWSGGAAPGARRPPRGGFAWRPVRLTRLWVAASG